MAEVSYEEFVNKKVTLVVGEDSRVGTVAAANAQILMFTPKGTSSPELVNVDDVTSVELLAEKPRKLNQKALDPVDDSKVRRHLLDYHGLELDRVNEWDDNKAAQVHDEIDHSVLGHHHEGRVKRSGAESDGEAGE